MGADNFMVFETGKTAQEAFDKAQDHALYMYGHAGYTGTIAEKPGYKLFGKVNSHHADSMEDYFFYAIDGKRNKIPRSVKDQVEKALATWDDKWGPAACFELTGTRAKEIKEARGRKGTHDKVYVFLGWASS